MSDSARGVLDAISDATLHTLQDVYGIDVRSPSASPLDMAISVWVNEGCPPPEFRVDTVLAPQQPTGTFCARCGSDLDPSVLSTMSLRVDRAARASVDDPSLDTPATNDTITGSLCQPCGKLVVNLLLGVEA